MPPPNPQIPIVDSELRKASSSEEGDQEEGGGVRETVKTLVTAHGTYATQSAFTATPTTLKESL